MPKVWSYLRVSSTDQIDNTSLETQKAAVMRDFEYRWKSQGFEFGEVFEDKAVSGGKPLLGRKEGNRLNMAAERGDVILFAKLDRGFRNTKDLLNTVEVWLARGVRPVFLDLSVDASTPIGQMVLTVMGAVAQFERSRLIERIRDGVNARRAKTGTVGKAVWGTRWMGSRKGEKRWLEAIPADYEIGEYICKMYTSGHSVESIYLHLLRHNITRALPKTQRKGRRGKRVHCAEWSYSAVQRTLTRFQKLKKLIEDGKVRFPKGYKPQEVAT
jgi:putative DNA-invertase from lambdoid prophage Rac